MKYEILYPEAFPVVECHLEKGESIKAESDAMISMSPTIDVEGKMDGGILSGLARKLLSGESMFFQELTARRGPGTVLFGHSLPGGIMDVELDGGEGYYFSGGKVKAINWTKNGDDSNFRFTDAETGEEITVNRGKCYIGITQRVSF